MTLSTIVTDYLSHFGGTGIYKGSEDLYFSLDLICKLPEFLSNYRFDEDITLVPYYIRSNKRMELYEYTLCIHIVPILQGREKYFLDETGAGSLAEIDVNVLERLENTFFEVLYGENRKVIDYLNHYIFYMSNKEPEIINTFRPSIKKSKDHSPEGIYYELI